MKRIMFGHITGWVVGFAVFIGFNIVGELKLFCNVLGSWVVDGED
jgi:hypothetical protein